MKTTNQITNYYNVYLEEAECVKGHKKETIKSGRSVFKTFMNLMPEISTLEELTPVIIKEFFKRLHRRVKSENREIKHSTIYTYYMRLNPFFEWLEFQGYIPRGSLHNQVPTPTQPTYSDIKEISKEDIEKLIAATSLESIRNHFLGLRDRTILYTFIYTGIRRGELLGLRIQDVDLENKTLYIAPKTSKSKKGRNIPINQILYLELRKYMKQLYRRKTTCGSLFLSLNQDAGLTNHGMKWWVKKYVEKTGVQFSMHSLRHTFACSLAKQNADIVSIKCALGHSSILMTERYLRSIGSENSRVYIDKLLF